MKPLTFEELQKLGPWLNLQEQVDKDHPAAQALWAMVQDPAFEFARNRLWELSNWPGIGPGFLSEEVIPCKREFKWFKFGFMVARIATDVGKFLNGQILELRQQRHDLNVALEAAKADAERWQALLSSGRIRVLGSANLGGEHQHLGLELWDVVPGLVDNTKSVKALATYVDGIRSRKKT